MEKPLKSRKKGTKRLSVLLFWCSSGADLIVFDVYVVLVLVCVIVA